MVDVVIDIGNTQMKWGRCNPTGISAIARLDRDPESWQQQRDDWELRPGTEWWLASVNPSFTEPLIDWLTDQGDVVHRIDHFRQVPVIVDVEFPERVGIDRLMNAAALRSELQPGQAVAIVDAGSAITVDWLTGDGRFLGGAILPGIGLMARALHQYTAALPLVTLHRAPPANPGRNTVEAIERGLFFAARSGIDALIRGYAQQAESPRVVWTGGYAPLLAQEGEIRPDLTLEGIRRVAEWNA
ncbi:type III pantothenate kinase [Tuwongella immobilis]|uniref:Type III pantothenate kinase n=1 Tax=Tuwongella immobilis TaxID=692036 RepID=A0A6C2YPS6_9BACT|nr:type III pantothenate kinase [Tuwongella immobilis]VIP03638.1 pantothenate kinase : Type III pantothenate kinase OS=Singulisphaera acidiphila (strain ATCC BAA-1392 / DSM 18658 / VKM B-2454 / MOB10) GN=coaX PE=3 SV=1: Pan_kinase [Tuwongella immobilis]VTS04644.1 pantothenate kinase : Type III pantothenate kinase OS=Singulisphaera acidiphila (strain ATCC BAA-1392 / DSM 18658 / VKM B-2454 / MOB10) GN=coaX PE=3 SV=1: Pan_kinase [Tuwongella immobilis]